MQEKAYQLQLATCNKRQLQQAANIVAARKEGGGILKRAFDLSIFRIEIAIESAIEIDKGCSMLSKIETEVAKTRSSMSIFMPIFVSIFLHEIDKASSTLHEIATEIAIEIDKLINHLPARPRKAM
jgi:tRNA 2-selenouridine synthase SelU